MKSDKEVEIEQLQKEIELNDELNNNLNNLNKIKSKTSSKLLKKATHLFVKNNVNDCYEMLKNHLKTIKTLTTQTTDNDNDKLLILLFLRASTLKMDLFDFVEFDFISQLINELFTGIEFIVDDCMVV